MNKDNPLTNIILGIIVIGILGFAIVIGKAILNANEESNKNKPTTEATHIFKYILYLIVGVIAVWLFAKVWFAIVGHPDENYIPGKLK